MTVGTGRTFAVKTDLSSVPNGTNVTASAPDYGASADGVVRAASTTPVQSPTPSQPVTTTQGTETTAVSTTNTDAEPSLQTAQSTTVTTETTDSSGPGFTVGLALSALLGVALLAARRFRRP